MDILKRILVFKLTWEARAVLRRYRPKIIAITGNVGKTSTKDALYAVLSSHLKVRKSDKSFNSELGVPLTILGCDNAWHNPFLWVLNLLKGLKLLIIPEVYPRWLILEVGADRPGDIKKIASWLKPDIVILTAINEVPVHVEYFDSPEAVVREKKTLADHIKPGGTLFVNGDDVRMRTALESYAGERTTFGFEQGNDFTATNGEIVYENSVPVGLSFQVNHAGESISVVIKGALGRPRMYAALAAIAVAKRLGIDTASAIVALSTWMPPPGRMRIIKGIRNSIIIDDSYNSSPAAVLSALDALKEIQTTGRKIAVLGDMLELGRYSADSHRKIGARAAKCADMLITVGFRTRATAEAALDAGMLDTNIRQYELSESARAGKELEHEIKEGNVILIKGSESMRMERAVLELMAEPEYAAELLVRQNPEWLEKK